MWRHGVLLCALLIGMLDGHPQAQTPTVFGFLDGSSRYSVLLAIEGAATRLGRPGCQEVLGDFFDAAGQPLATAVAASGRSASAAFALLRFFDTRDAPQCRGAVTMAFTQVGSRVVRVCSRLFRFRSVGNRASAEILLIHEFLHTLGLGENPPASQAITAQVSVRCGD